LVIDDPKCRAKYEFNSIMPAVGLCVEGLKPGNYGLEKPEDDLSFENLVQWVPTMLTKHQMRWSERAAQVIGPFEQNAFVYIVPELGQEMVNSWLTKVFMIAAEYVNDKTEGTIGLVAPFFDNQLDPGVPQLSEMMRIEDKEILPKIFVFHSKANKLSVYDYSYNDYEISPEMLILWARREILASDIIGMEAFIEELKERKEELTEGNPDHYPMFDQTVLEQIATLDDMR